MHFSPSPSIGMVLANTNQNCVWCGRRLVHSSYQADCDAGFGPRPRSDEHIIPRVLFGKLVTRDLCRCCNSRFGEQCDYAIVEDKRIVDAAQRVGLSVADLWSRFEGVQHTPDGRAVKTVFKAGTFKPQSELKSLNKLSIAATEGKIRPEDLKNLRARLIAKVGKKGLKLSGSQIAAEVDKLLNGLQASPEQTHYNSAIGEGFKASPLNSKVMVSTESRPWETEWVLAKIVVELSKTVAATPYRIYFAQVVNTVKDFLERRKCSADRKQGVGIFKYVELPATNAAKCHTIEGVMTPKRFEWNLTFFGTARWTYSMDVTPIHAPKQSQHVVIQNWIESADASVSSTMMP